jgi:hypothetical protein
MKPLLEKLGVVRGMRVALLGVDDDAFRAALLGLGADVVDEDVRPGTPLVVLQAESPDDLDVLSDLRERIARDGAVWVLWPKGGVAGIGEQGVMHAGLAAGLVDVKVVSFSERLSGLKFVIRLADR